MELQVQMGRLVLKEQWVLLVQPVQLVTQDPQVTLELKDLGEMLALMELLDLMVRRVILEHRVHRVSKVAEGLLVH